MFERYSLDILGKNFDLKSLHMVRDAISPNEWSSIATGIIRLVHKNMLLEEQSLYDELTGLPNRRYFNQTLDKEIAASHRYGHALSLVIFDIDKFKNLNDTHGHDVGDKVLQNVARTCQEHIRLSDTASRSPLTARIGGEEFGIILPHTPVHGAYSVAERLREYLKYSRINFKKQDLGITISLGVAGYHSLHEADTIMSKNAILEDRNLLMRHADEALYEAKRGGRNCTVVYEKTHPQRE
jgi:diguanylate cyclase (GGDEF)-like protein